MSRNKAETAKGNDEGPDLARERAKTSAPSVPWLQLRSWKGSQHDAFEELCCQLAHSEPVSGRAVFRRKGRPDSGIECYWTLSDGKEWGWQAKFFPGGLDDKRWAQCDKSVRKALDGHSDLSRLYFCIPHDFPDARNAGRRSAEDRWHEHRTKWKRWAAKLGREVEFVLWDEHELTLRLSKAEHRGRWWFWFNGPAMDDEWFRRHVAAAAALAAASDRYTSEFNVEVPLAKHFEALGRTPAFAETLDVVGSELNGALVELQKHRSTAGLESVVELKARLETALKELNALPADPAVLLNFGPLELAVRNAETLADTIRSELWQKRREQAAKAQQRGRSADGQEVPNYDFAFYTLSEISGKLAEVVKFCISRDAQLCRTPAMYIVGEPGQGKTQLVCTVAEKL